MKSGSLPPELRQAMDDALAPAIAAQASQDAALLQRVGTRLMRALATGTPSHRTVRADEGVWQEIAPGVTRKLLHTSGDAVSCLIRMAAGSRVPGHLHTIDEECVVLEGSLAIGEHLTLHAGDFHLGAAGMAHADATTCTGALVYLRAAR